MKNQFPVNIEGEKQHTYSADNTLNVNFNADNGLNVNNYGRSEQNWNLQG